MFAHEDDYNTIVFAAAAAWGVEAAIILAIIGIESSFQWRAVRYEPRLGTNSVGLMQLLSTTAISLGYPGDDRLFDPDININAGSQYLSEQLSRYGGSLDDAVSGYNAGHSLRKNDGSFGNQTYVDRFHVAYDYFKKKLQAQRQVLKSRFLNRSVIPG